MSLQSSIAYDAIKKWILDGECEPGQRLVEEELARRVGVSRTSIRDGLRRLAADGLVRIEASRGTFVMELDAPQVDEVFQLRAILEGHGAGLAARQGSGDQFDALARIAEEIDEMLVRRDLAESALYAQFQSSNTRFHLALLEASGSLRLQSMARTLIEVPLVALKQHTWPGEVSVRRSNAQHWELIDALRARDPVLARLCVQSHILAARPRAMVAASGVVPSV